jgi:hypothetical protein
LARVFRFQAPVRVVGRHHVVLARLAAFDQGHLGVVEQLGAGQHRRLRVARLDLGAVEVELAGQHQRRSGPARGVLGHDVEAARAGVDRVGEELRLADLQRIEDGADRAGGAVAQAPLPGAMLLENTMRSSMSMRYRSAVSEKFGIGRSTMPMLALFEVSSFSGAMPKAG